MPEPQTRNSGEFASWRSYWNFARSVSREFRYIHSLETKAFLTAVLETSASRRVQVPKGCLLWRAQVGHSWRRIDDEVDDEIPCAYPRSRMKPQIDRASDGRANSRGIPCLYLATTKEAAMSEVRPWIGSYVSCGQFQLNRPLTVIDCARRLGSNPLFFSLDTGFYEPSPEKRSEAVWSDIDRAFAEPMTRSDDQAEYAPTQILAELFKNAGSDGVVYKSNFGEDGFNVALFDPDAADLINCGLFEVSAMSLTFHERDQFYHVVDQPKPQT